MSLLGTAAGHLDVGPVMTARRRWEPRPLRDRRIPRGTVSDPTRPAEGSMGGHLVVVDEPGGLRRFPLGQPVHEADRLAEGRWRLGRYENVRGDDFLRPLFYYDLPCSSAPPDWTDGVPFATTDLEARVELPPNACLRWPTR